MDDLSGEIAQALVTRILECPEGRPTNLVGAAMDALRTHAAREEVVLRCAVAAHKAVHAYPWEEMPEVEREGARTKIKAALAAFLGEET